MEVNCDMQVQSFHRDGRAIVAIVRFVSAAAAAACFGWLLLVVMGSSLRAAEGDPRIRAHPQSGERTRYELPSHAAGCDCPVCERELCRARPPDSLVDDDSAFA
jgi:hypothetical protein